MSLGNPVAHRFEPRAGVALYILRDIEVGKPVELAGDITRFLPQAVERDRRSFF